MQGLKGEHERAIADYDKAIDLEPRSAADHTYGRGLEKFALGRYASAADDIKTRIDKGGLVPTTAIDILWLYWAKARAGSIDLKESRDASAKLDLAKWPVPLLPLAFGQMTTEQVNSVFTDRPAKD